MAAPQVDVSLVAVLVAAVANMVVGALWYSPLLFAKPWMAMSGMTEKKIAEAKKKGGSMAKSYALAFVGSLVMSYVLAHFIRYAQAATPIEGAIAGFWVWLGFIATVLLSSFLWEGKPFKLYVLNIAHYLVALVVTGAVLAAWP